jgi:hypothetical protein
MRPVADAVRRGRVSVGQQGTTDFRNDNHPLKPERNVEHRNYLVVGERDPNYHYVTLYVMYHNLLCGHDSL